MNFKLVLIKLHGIYMELEFWHKCTVADIRYSLVLPFCFCWLCSLTESDELAPADPELLPVLPMTPTPLPGAKLPTGLSETREEPCTPDWPELNPRIPDPMLFNPDVEPSRPPVEDVGPPTAMLAVPMEPNVLLVVVVMTPPREPAKLDPIAPAAAAWA